MAKVHLQANTGDHMEAFSFCASRLKANGKVAFNQRRSYTSMDSPIVRFKEFLATPGAERCAHCIDVLRQRKDKFPIAYARICEGA